MKIAILLVVAGCFCDLQAAVVEHGPIVHWNQDPTKSCRIVWMERAGEVGAEGQWGLGPAGFGYGDGDDATVFGNMKGRYLSVAARCHVKPQQPVDPKTTLILRVNYDDGFIAWCGGREIARRNITDLGGKVRAAGTHEAGVWEDIPLGNMERFLGKEGAVLAIEGFNNQIGSSDFTLHATLIAKVGPREWPLVPPGHSWEYLVNARPEEGWQNQALSLKPGSGQAADGAFELRYRVKGGDDWRAAVVATKPFGSSMHRVVHAELKGLPSGRDVEFRITAKGRGDSEVFRFRMPPAEAAPVRFVTGGDIYHNRERMDRMNRRAGLEDPLFALIGGDLAYANDVKPERWLDYVDSWVANARTPDGRLLPKVVAIGNHETLGAGYHPNDAPGPEAARLFYGLFEFPNGSDATHAVDFGSWLSLVMLDSGHTKSIATQTSWLDGILESRSKVPQLFACYHRPAWGAGAKDDSIEIRREWCPLFERHRVSAVFEYDHHVFCRSHPVRNGVVDPVNGIPYLGSGAWSVDVRKVDAAEVRKRPWVAASGPHNHLYVIETRDGGFTATAKDIEGKVIDRYDRAWKR